MSSVRDGAAEGVAALVFAACASASRCACRASTALTAATCLVAVSAASCGESPSSMLSNALCSQAFASSGSIGKCFAAQACTSPRQPLPRLQHLSVQTRQKLRKSCSLRREASRSASVSTGSSSSSVLRACAVVLVILLMLCGTAFLVPGACRGSGCAAPRSLVRVSGEPDMRARGAERREAHQTCALRRTRPWRRALAFRRSTTAISVPGAAFPSSAFAPRIVQRAPRSRLVVAGERGPGASRVRGLHLPAPAGAVPCPAFRMPPEAPLMDRVWEYNPQMSRVAEISLRRAPSRANHRTLSFRKAPKPDAT